MIKAREAGIDVRKCVISVIVKKLGKIDACQQNVEPAIVVIVSPSRGTQYSSGQSGIAVGKSAIPVIVIKPGNRSGTSCNGMARQQKIEFAVVVVVSPRDRTIINARQTCVDVCKGAISIVVIEAGYAFCSRDSRQQEIQPAIVVIVSRSYGTTGNARQ